MTTPLTWDEIDWLGESDVLALRDYAWAVTRELAALRAALTPDDPAPA